MSRAAYETDYAHDRRSHRHRCRCCWKAIETGEPVIMAKVGGRRRRGGRVTWALHEACADKRFGGANNDILTWRHAFNAWLAEQVQ